MSRGKHLGWLLGIAVSGVMVWSTNRAYAQITPDGTLPTNVQLNGTIFNITGGTLRGGNLFHSFREFSIPTGGEAFFNNAVDIQNIISRVTGGSISNINGLIRANGTANFFLINPGGIVFGRNASLNVGGSFVATTANAIQFGDIGFFSATNPEAPSPLLTINPSALLFNQMSSASIQNNSVARAEVDPARFDTFGLHIPDGRSLLLVGGDISMDGGGLNAFGGRVELGGLSQEGTIGLEVNNNTLSLNFPTEVTRSDVSLVNGAMVDVRTNTGGNIILNVRNLELGTGSALKAGLAEGIGTVESRAGNIEVNAQAAVNLSQESFISNTVPLGTLGRAGDISINAASLSLTNNARLDVRTFGQGDAGNITITARDNISVEASAVISNVEAQAVGTGGNISISTGTLSLSNSAQLFASTRGRGDAGNVIITARDNISFDRASVFSDVEAQAVGSGGDINISTGSLFLSNVGSDFPQLAVRTFGQGDAGSITITARDNISVQASAVVSSVEAQAVGTGGNISISTGTLSLSNGAQLFASTRGRGDAGDVTITARDNISFDRASVFSDVEAQAVGSGGDINISTGSLSLSNVGSDFPQLAVRTFGQGDAGNITITARDNISLNSSGVFSGVEAQAIGTGGDISISTGTLSLSKGAQLFASTRGQGNAGNVTITAQDNISFDGTAVFTTVEAQAVGSGGDINISTGSLSLINNAQLNTESNGQGAAGDIKVRARSIRLDDRSGILATTASGNGGGITLSPQDFLLLRRQSQVSTTAGTAQQGGDGGNITIDTPNGFIIAVDNENSDITANAFTGSGGKVDITTSGIFGIQPRPRPTLFSDITASSEFGVSGVVTINTSPVDFGLGLVELAADIVDASELVDTSCTAFADGEGSTFLVTGRGGLPPSPNEPLTNDVIWTDTRIPNITALQPDTADLASSKNHAVAVVPATGWVFNGKGEVTLISASNTALLGNRNGACQER